MNPVNNGNPAAPGGVLPAARPQTPLAQRVGRAAQNRIPCPPAPIKGMKEVYDHSTGTWVHI